MSIWLHFLESKSFSFAISIWCASEIHKGITGDILLSIKSILILLASLTNIHGNCICTTSGRNVIIVVADMALPGRLHYLSARDGGLNAQYDILRSV